MPRSGLTAIHARPCETPCVQQSWVAVEAEVRGLGARHTHKRLQVRFLLAGHPHKLQVQDWSQLGQYRFQDCDVSSVSGCPHLDRDVVEPLFDGRRTPSPAAAEYFAVDLNTSRRPVAVALPQVAGDPEDALGHLHDQSQRLAFTVAEHHGRDAHRGPDG